MIPDAPAVRAAAEAVARVAAENPLDALLVRWSRAPWRVVVAGRVGVGKTTLVNRLVGDAAGEVGLGGVTRAPVVHRVGGVEVIDTPGIDDPDVARIELAPLLADADAVVWVIDGLLPAGAVEREILGGVEAVRHVVVSRLDLLEPADRDAVLARAHALVPGPTRGGDARTLPLDGLLDAPEGGSPRRRRALADAVARARAVVEAVPPAPTRGELVEAARRAWRREVRETEALIAEEIDRGLVDHRDRALRRLHLLAPHAVRRLRASWDHLLPDVPLPTLPAPPEPVGTAPMLAVVAGGAEGAGRALRAAAGQWLVEGEIAISDALEAATLADRDAPRREALAALDALAAP